ncbi:hypothetical protein [Vibrio crassostreae]|uniref:hypothetical protein n=1 Tax=Vibrio crassostreae TaxID=246167 RepID=UPI001B310AF1|nr:hypothetical protein [Vibrio crassostreae]
MEALIQLILGSVALFVLFYFVLGLYTSVIIPAVSIFNKDKAFSLRLSVAERHNMYKGESFLHSKGLPQARVLYPDGFISKNMPIGNAVDYRQIFGGQVIKPN